VRLIRSQRLLVRVEFTTVPTQEPSSCGTVQPGFNPMKNRLIALIALLAWCVPVRGAIFQNHWTTNANALVLTNKISTNGASLTKFLGFDGTTPGWFTPTSAATNNSIYVDGSLTAAPNLDSDTNVIWEIRNSTNLVGVLTNISGSQILSGAISNAHVSTSAAIAYSKLSLANSLVFSDFGTFLNTNVALLTGTNIFTGTNTFRGITLLTNTANVLAGDGSSITALNGTSISSGTVSDARLSANVALLNANQTFSGVNALTNLGNTISGNGAGLTNLNASNLASGTVNSNRLQIGTTTQTGIVKVDGSTITVAGDGTITAVTGGAGSVTNVTSAPDFTSAGAGTGLIVLTPTNMARLNGTNTFAGTNTFSIIPIVPNDSWTDAKIVSITTRSKLPSPLAYEDEANAFAERTTFNGDILFGTSDSSTINWDSTGDLVTTITTNGSYTISFTGTPANQTFRDHWVTNTATTNISAGFPAAYHVQEGTDAVTNVTVLANSRMHIRFFRTGGGYEVAVLGKDVPLLTALAMGSGTSSNGIPVQYNGTNWVFVPTNTASAKYLHPTNVLPFYAFSDLPSAGGAPTDAIYLLGTNNGTLSAERVPANTATVQYNEPAAGQFSFSVVAGSIGTTQLADGSVSEIKFGLADNTTSNATTAMHGLMPKLNGNTNTFFNGNGTQTAVSPNAILTNGAAVGNVMTFTNGNYTPLASAATAWDAIGDPVGNGTINFGTTQQEINSALVSGNIFTINNTVADATADMQLIRLTHTDGADANVIYFRAVGDEDGTPRTDYNLTQTAFAVDPNITVSFGATTVSTLDTGQGANELFDMDQNVLTTSDVNFASITNVAQTVSRLTKTDANKRLTDAIEGTDYLSSSSTNTPTNKTFDAAGTGNVLKQIKEWGPFTIDTWRKVDNAGCTIPNTNDFVLNTFMVPQFSGTAASNANFMLFMTRVPKDIDTSVALTASITVELTAADTAAHSYHVGVVSVANSAQIDSTPTTFIDLAITGDGSGVAEDIESVNDVTLTGWAATLTANQWAVIELRRNGADTSTVASRFQELKIYYTSTQ